MSSATTTPGAISLGVPARSRARILRPVLMLGGIAAVVAGAGWWWLQGGRYVSVDDAYIRAAKLAVSNDEGGIVGTVNVHEGQHVRKGDLLFTLRDRQVRIALAGAKANLAQTALVLQSMQRDYKRMLSDVATRQALVEADQANFDRFSNLVRSGGVTRAQYDDARFKLASDKAALESAKDLASVQLARLGGNPDADVTTMPQYLQAKARVDEFQRELDHTIVRAPFDGIVTNVEAAQPGMYLSTAQAAFGLVSDSDLWVEASPKETELTWVKPGDPVEVTVDTYPGRVWHGTVESIAPASASEFSVLPAQNSSGNWVKVVQRLPVRIHLDRKPGDPPLSAGMSVEADIDTGHTRHFADLLP
ncbi:MAG: HlyD family secretion protein [Rhodospirillales bacterium]|nr:HlyD family secretion protein [Rhodospirillales bacterium]